MKNKVFKKSLLMLMSVGLLTGCGENSSVSSNVGGSSYDNQIYAVYESYKANGGTLSYEEWLASIKGQDGLDGKDGEKGEKGDKGDTGAAGKSAYELYCEKHPDYKGTEDEWLEALTTGKLNKITISFDTYGGSTMDDVITSFGSYITVDAPSKNGYEFDGWTLNGSDIDVNTYVFFASCTLKAKWKKVTYTITYVLDEGTNDVSNPYEYDIESENITLADAKKPYYEFEGWYSDASFTTKVTSIKKGSYGDMTLYAKWFMKKDYTITYELDGGTNSKDNPTNYNNYSGELILSDPSKEDYAFKGWYTESTFQNRVTSIPAGNEDDITLYAKWVELDSYEITYVLNGGDNSSSNPVSYNGSKEVLLYKPTKEHAIFKGWYTDSEYQNKIDSISEGTTGELTLYAKWEAAQYSIEYNLNGGTNDSSNPTSYTYFDDDVILKEPTRTGYTFEGWYSDSGYSEKVNEISSGSDGTKNLYANWSADITYELDGGTNDADNPSTYETKDGNITLKDASKTGYIFMGWYKDEDYSERVCSLNAENDVTTLYAKFMTQEDSLAKSVKLSKNKKYATYGLYPQTHVSDSTLLSSLNTLTTAETNGWYLYENQYYAKLSAKPYSSNYTFDDGTTIVSGTTYWFKCEPIKWKVLEGEYGEYKLLSDVILDAHCYYNSTNDRTIDGKTVYANNYEYSDIRTWLNGDFYDSAFSLDSSYIQDTVVDNSAATTESSTNPYACENTTDKVYLPSYQDYNNADYGFSTSSDRQCKTTEYARADGAYSITSSGYENNGYYWTRSPIGYYSYIAWPVRYDGYLRSDFVGHGYYGVRPSLSVKLS